MKPTLTPPLYPFSNPNLLSTFANRIEIRSLRGSVHPVYLFVSHGISRGSKTRGKENGAGARGRAGLVAEWMPPKGSGKAKESPGRAKAASAKAPAI